MPRVRNLVLLLTLVLAASFTPATGRAAVLDVNRSAGDVVPVVVQGHFLAERIVVLELAQETASLTWAQRRAGADEQAAVVLFGATVQAGWAVRRQFADGLLRKRTGNSGPLFTALPPPVRPVAGPARIGRED